MRSSIDGDSIFNCLGEIQFQGDFGWFSVILTVGNLSVIPFENETIGRGRYSHVMSHLRSLVCTVHGLSQDSV